MSAIAKAAIPVQMVDAEAAERRMMLAFLCFGFSALMIGASIGPMQALNYNGINVYPYLRPALQTYYQGLTVHGVLSAYVFIFFVASGLLVYLPARELKISPNMALWYLCFAMMSIGTLMLLYAMFDNSSSVLWTFYPPVE
jgi:cytochrome c oxidase subunit 1